MPESLIERIDDAILCAAWRLAHLRGGTVRGGIMDFRASCVENAALDDDPIWHTRVDRCNAILFHEDADLRKMAQSALERER